MQDITNYKRDPIIWPLMFDKQGPLINKITEILINDGTLLIVASCEDKTIRIYDF